jgi:hypothetical protein
MNYEYCLFRIDMENIELSLRRRFVFSLGDIQIPVLPTPSPSFPSLSLPSINSVYGERRRGIFHPNSLLSTFFPVYF